MESLGRNESVCVSPSLSSMPKIHSVRTLRERQLSHYIFGSTQQRQSWRVRDTHGATDVYLQRALDLVFGVGHDGKDSTGMRGSRGSRPWRQGDGKAAKDGNGDGSGLRDARDALAVVLLRTANSTSATALVSFSRRNRDKTLVWDARLPLLVVMEMDRLDSVIQVDI